MPELTSPSFPSPSSRSFRYYCFSCKTHFQTKTNDINTKHCGEYAIIDEWNRYKEREEKIRRNDKKM